MSAYRNFDGVPGLELWQTGGGCTALGKNSDFGGYVLLTVRDDPTRPMEGEAFLVGFYDEETGEPVDHADLEYGCREFAADASDQEVNEFIDAMTNRLRKP